MHIIGTNKVRFVSLQKNGSTSLRVILKANKSIRGWYTSDQDINHKYPYKESDLLDKKITFIFPLRDPLARKKSAMLQKIHAKYHAVSNIKDLEKHIKNYLLKFSKYQDELNYWHCSLYKDIIKDNFKKNREIKANIIFIELKTLSSWQLNKFLCKLDPSWKDIVIPHENASTNNVFKEAVMNIITKLSQDKESGVLDWFERKNWDLANSYELLDVIKNSEYFYSPGKLLGITNKDNSCLL